MDCATQGTLLVKVKVAGWCYGHNESPIVGTAHEDLDSLLFFFFFFFFCCFILLSKKGSFFLLGLQRFPFVGRPVGYSNLWPYLKLVSGSIHLLVTDMFEERSIKKWHLGSDKFRPQGHVWQDLCRLPLNMLHTKYLSSWPPTFRYDCWSLFS